MIKLAIYSRDESGLIRYLGVQHWESASQMLKFYGRDDKTSEQESLVGWPDSAVTWHGDLGYAIQDMQE